MKKEEYFIIEGLVGSLIIPPHKIKKIFNIAFKAGMKCNELHPDDDSYDNIHLQEAIDKIIKSLDEAHKREMKKSPYAKGGKKCKLKKIKL